MLIVTAVLATSCGEGSTDRLTAAEVAAYQNYIMSSYYMARGDEALPESRAAWDYTETITLPGDDETTEPVTSRNYPEKGQKTTVTITRDGSWAADVYKVVNVTEYPKQDSITSTTESYYIKDYPSGSPDGIYDAGVDPICKETGTLDPLERIEFTTVFDDKTKRKEIIESVYPTVSFDEFDIDGPLVFPVSNDSNTWGGGTFNEDGDEWTPGSTPAEVNTNWSSVVSYDQTMDESNYFWTKTTRIIGIRYYTEQDDSDIRTSVTYERTIETTSETEDLSDFAILIKKLFQGRNEDFANTTEGTTYTETVIRTRIEGNKKKKVNSESRVYDEGGQTIVTFIAKFAEDENGLVTSSGAPVVVY